MKTKSITKRLVKSQPSPLMSEAIRGLIQQWEHQERIKKDGQKASDDNRTSKLMP